MSVASSIIEALESLGEFVKDLSLWVPRKIAEQVLDGLAMLIEAIPVPDAVAEWNSSAGAAFADAGYIAEIFALDVGLALVGSALLARFLLRRIPFIG